MIIYFRLFLLFSDIVLFDNTYSYFKNKRIRHSVILTPPVSVDEFEKGADILVESGGDNDVIDK